MSQVITRKGKPRLRKYTPTPPVITPESLTCDPGAVLLELLHRMNPPANETGGHE